MDFGVSPGPGTEVNHSSHSLPSAAAWSRAPACSRAIGSRRTPCPSRIVGAACFIAAESTMRAGGNTGVQQIGKFQLRKVLGKGASGTVYLALDTFYGRDVALKVLEQEVLASPDFERTVTAQFLNEASLAGKLQHPHIAAILEASVTR